MHSLHENLVGITANSANLSTIGTFLGWWNMSSTEGELRIEQHVVTLLAEDIVHVEWRGDVTRDHILAVGRMIAARPHGGRGVFLVQDHAKLGNFSPGARKAITIDPNSRFVRDVIVYNASFQLRIIMTMIQKAMNTFRPVVNASMTFVDSKADAFRFAEKRRQAIPGGGVG